ncbi:DUF7693 family protein [Pseudomonas syringae]|uniref:DUF7693 family protein n=1 Tax=Pseudomonas syringae TaxID=317 RepID=UPI000B3F1932|nr:hypothetical protein [Pseudomonas syringae]
MGPTQSHKGTFRSSAKPLTAREAYQVLRDIALGVRTMRRLGEKSWTEMYSGMMTVETDGWVITFYNDCESLDYCDSCYCPDGRAYTFDSSQLFGTDPVELLSTWEHAQLEQLVSKL